MLTQLIFLSLLFSNAFADQPTLSLPYGPVLDLSSMNPRISPCVDFYQYACGGWIKKNPIPPDQSSWDVFSKLNYDNQHFLWGLLEEASKHTTSESPYRKIGSFFNSCTNQVAIEKLDLQPIQKLLDATAAIQTLSDLSQVISEIHSQGVSSDLLFSIDSDQDYEDSDNVIAFANPGSLGLPDRDFYTKDDNKSAEIRGKYLRHLRQEFQLLGDTQKDAEYYAQRVLSLETALAKSMLTRVELRDPKNVFHKFNRKNFENLAPSIDWHFYLDELNLGKIEALNVTEPNYYRELERLLIRQPITDWRAFIRWNLVRDYSPYLSHRFVQANFEFYSNYLDGVPQLKPRWKYCVNWIDEGMGESLSQLFVEKTFLPETKFRALKMVQEIELAMENELKSLSWMTGETREHALKKLHSVRNNIGYPDHWRDYSLLEIKDTDFAGNIQRASAFERRRQLAKIGKPVVRDEWGMTPSTVNAFYRPQLNDINFPAGVLQPPLFDIKLDDAPNYGNTGSTIGHELTHAFDDEGRKYDSKGNLKDWWTEIDSQKFERLAACTSRQYSAYVAIDNIHINGDLTVGEDIADLGGTVLAYLAWKNSVRQHPLKPIDGLTPDQRFFIGMAQWACGSVRPEKQRVRVITDVHSPARYRVNGVVANIPDFAAAFSCKEKDPMVRKNICRIW